MKKLKQLLAVLVCVTMVLAAVPGFGADENGYGVTEDGIEYMLYDDYVEIMGYNGDATELKIPAKIEGAPVTSIGWYAFSYCTSLTNVNIPASVTMIDWGAFSNCASLTSVNIPASVTMIGLDAFSYCDSLTEISVDEENVNYRSQDGVLFDKEMTELIQYPVGNSRPSYSIPDGVTSIGHSAFGGCESLASVNIPASVTSIDGNAFWGCKSLANVNIPGRVTQIGSYAFAVCTSLTNVSIPAGVTSIGNSAFAVCTSLANVIISDGVTSIDAYAFESCTSLASITIPASVTSIGRWAFDGCTGLADVYYGGSADDWAAIEIEAAYNERLTDATIHYNSSVVPEPTVPEIKGVQAEVKDDAVNVTVTETQDIPSTAELIAIAIGTDGKITDISPVEDGKVSLDGKNIKTVKVFAWESLESMRPLCPAKEVML